MSEPIQTRVPQDEVPVDLAGELRDSQIQEVLDQLDRELVGLNPIKSRI